MCACVCACGAPAGPGGGFDVDGSMFGETSTVTTATVAVADSAVASVGGGALFVPVGVGSSLGFLHHTSLCNFVCVCVCVPGSALSAAGIAGAPSAVVTT